GLPAGKGCRARAGAPPRRGGGDRALGARPPRDAALPSRRQRLAMLMPRRVKHRKHHRGRLTGKPKGGPVVTFGAYGIQAMEPGWIPARQIEAARIAMTRHIKRGGKVWINVFTDTPVSATPAAH